MAANTGKDHRVGAVKNRAQVQNPVTKKWIKIDTKTGKIVDVKSSKGQFKGVRVLDSKRAS
ncbi:hypothetical protein [Oricola sp.]|uniref:hypothetical protein n=1 Tax=Oricola sp. TaxID=1979950 RepID=UPI00320BB707|nr:hypothetical protein [Oricola sp.]